MDALLDRLWAWILVTVQHIVTGIDVVVAPLNHLGPAAAITLIALATVAFSKFFSRHYRTSRYVKLEKAFRYWFDVRQEALKCADGEKAKLLAKNIDQAELNRVYYDYFFEGLLNSLLTRYLPLISMLAYVNNAYRPERLKELFGRSFIFSIPWDAGKDPIALGAAFWFVASVVLVYLAWPVMTRIRPARKSRSTDKISYAAALKLRRDMRSNSI